MYQFLVSNLTFFMQIIIWLKTFYFIFLEFSIKRIFEIIYFLSGDNVKNIIRLICISRLLDKIVSIEFYYKVDISVYYYINNKPKCVYLYSFLRIYIESGLNLEF